MSHTIRSQNLDLARYLRGGHEALCKKLSNFTNAAYISQMATGQREISDHDMMRIEEILTLPKGWLDRNNLDLLQIPPNTYQLHQRIAKLSRLQQEALANLLSDAPTEGSASAG